MGWKNNAILITLFVVACTLFVFLVYNENGVKLVDAKRAEHKAVLAENLKMEEENADMARTIQRLKDDPFYVEFVARQEYGLTGPDDLVFTFDKTRAGKPVWPEERAADDARRAAEAKKLKMEHEGAAQPGKKPSKPETAKPEKSKSASEKTAPKKPEADKPQKKKET